MTNLLFKKNINRSLGGNIAILLILLIFGIFMIFPIIYAVGNSFKTLDQLYIFPPLLLPRRLTLDNYINLSQITLYTRIPFSRYAFNSAFISIASTLGAIFISSMAAYPLAKNHFIGKNLINSLIVLALLFSANVTYLPSYVVMSKMHIVNTYWCLILPSFQSSLGLYLMRNFMEQINNSMIEAAKIDGSSDFGVYWNIIMPNVKPAWLTLIVYTFQAVWNGQGTTNIGTLSGNLIYNESLKTIPTLFSSIGSAGTSRAGIAAAAAVIVMLPPMIIFILCQNKVIETMSTSGLK